MRVSTNSLYQRNLQSILNTNSKYQTSGLHLTTGKRILTPSDDPIGTTQALILKQEKEKNQQFLVARDNADKSLSHQDTILGSVNTVIQNIKETLVYAGDGILSDDNLKDLANKLQGLKDQLFSLANSQDGNGNYIFAGNKNDTPPFVKDNNGVVSYVGGTTTINVLVDNTREIPLSFTGIQVFMTGSNPNAERDIFASIDHALVALNNGINDPQYQTELSKANLGIENSFDNFNIVRANGGSLLSEIEELTELGKTVDIEFDGQISQLEDVDWYEAISDYVMLQANLQAAQYVFKTMQSMSLFQM